jgi:predicted GNAT family acetyltransferase
MLIQHEETAHGGRFYLSEDGNDLAEMVYSRQGEHQITILHTEVDPSLEGKGVGKALVAAAVEYARAGDIKIYPICPYAKKVLERTEEYQDVLVKP